MRDVEGILADGSDGTNGPFHSRITNGIVSGTSSTRQWGLAYVGTEKAPRRMRSCQRNIAIDAPMCERHSVPETCAVLL